MCSCSHLKELAFPVLIMFIVLTDGILLPSEKVFIICGATLAALVYLDNWSILIIGFDLSGFIKYNKINV